MTVTIRRLGHQGDGVADGPVFVPQTLPGETVEGEISEGRICAPRILAPSPHRVRPVCRHFKTCGGCAVQHASDDFVARWKVDVVETALAAQGLSAPMLPILTSPAGTRRRAVLAGRRTRKGAIVGFHGRASNTLVEIPDCHLLHPDIMAGLPMLRGLVPLGASRKGELGLSLTRSEAGLDLSVTGARPLDGALWAELGAFAQAHDLARLTWNGELVVEIRPPVQHFGPAAVVPPPGAFLQATAAGEAALSDAVARAVGPARSVADLFAGCGTFALPLAQVADVHAVEGNAAMLRALDSGWRHTPGLKRVTTETRDLFRRPLLAEDLARFEAVVFDPPRAGAAAQSRQIAASGVAVVAAVSCNPVTFARDAATLAQAGFGLDWVQVVDQFRWSAHVELAARFSRIGDHRGASMTAGFALP